MRDEFFSLDIGTRKVMGIVASRSAEGLEIVDACTLEHTGRPMLDGQVHNIEDVSRSVAQVKHTLEQRLGRKLDKAAVAVAGRNLQTYRCSSSRSFELPEEITDEMVRSLELEAVDGLHQQLSSSLESFYCAGYSPVWYELDGLRMKTLLGHRGRRAAVELIVTFLPRAVLDSIFAVMRKVKLQVTGITLEPIAAMHAIIPQDMRNLNIVLVDIGAGTSDIAISKDGLVHAFGMVPEAGDEITDAVSQGLLVDFQAAEKIKRSLGRAGTVCFKDIWAREHTVDARRVHEIVLPAVRRLSDSIASRALELNGCMPQAVVVVGGGSLTCHLLEELARSFGISGDKVGMRLPSMIEGVVDHTASLAGPEAVTPIGIALVTGQSKGLHFITLEVNGRKVYMLDFQQKKDILGALMLSGCMSEKRLYPHPGLALTLSVNGEFKTVKGTLGSLACVAHNGKPAVSLSEPVSDGDRLEVAAARDGEDARAKVRDVVDLGAVRFNFNAKPVELLPAVTMNGAPARLDADVPDRAVISAGPVTLRQALSSLGIDSAGLFQRQVLVTVNGTPQVLTQRNFTLAVNGEHAELDAVVQPLSSVEFSRHQPTSYRIRDIVPLEGREETVQISVNGEAVVAPVKTVQVTMNGQDVSADEFVIDNADIRVSRAAQRSLLLSDIFNYVPFDARQGAGKRLRILVDDVPAGFTTAVKDGSSVRVFFEER